MERDRTDAPALWLEELARGDDEVARNERVPASVVHDDMLRAIADLDAELAENSDAAAPEPPGR
jgi:hypothetical protein